MKTTLKGIVPVAALLLVVAMLAASCGGSDSAKNEAIDDDHESIVLDTHDDGDGHEAEDTAAYVDEDADGHEAEDTAAHVDGDGDGHEAEDTAAHVDEDADGHEVEEVAVHTEDGDEGDVVEVTLNAVEGRNWGFDPSAIELAVGQRVKLTLVNDGKAEHDLEIAGLAAEHIEMMGGMAHEEKQGGGHHGEEVIAAHAVPGTAASVMFTPLEAGVFEYACTLPGHKEAGMFGAMTVTSEVVRAAE